VDTAPHIVGSTPHRARLRDRWLIVMAACCVPAAMFIAACREGGAARGATRVDTDLPKSAPHPLGADFHRGVDHAHVHSRGHGYGSAVSAAELDSLRGLGVNCIAITPFGFQEGASADRIVGFDEDSARNDRSDRSLTDNDLAAEIASAHRLGIKVTLKPHLWSHDFWNGGAWHGTVDQTTPEDHARWWRSYRAFALHYARLAESAGADLYCIGTELVKITTQHPDEWRALIADIRREYHGKLSYAAHWDMELDSIPFWDALDYIGVTAYFPLNVSDSASIDDLVAAWQPVRKRLTAIAARYQRPILFLEAGYRPVAGTYRQPWLYEGGTPDPNAQARAYEAMFRALSEEPWWRGVYIWKTFTDPERAHRYGEDMGFTFRGLPAQNVLAGWFKAN
jgi:hypothetical protein